MMFMMQKKSIWLTVFMGISMLKKINSKYIETLFETDSQYSEWFGYYNYDVINSDATKMLCNRVDFDGRAITNTDIIELGYYDLGNGEWHHIAVSDSFNWQQGAMLQWLPNHQDKVIFNYSDKQKFYSCIVDINTGDKKTIAYPIYCITPDGKYSISLDYERSYWCRAYHYQPVVNEELNVQIAEGDGIFRVNLLDDTVERIVSIRDVLSIDPDDDFNDAKHWFEHIMISPSGSRVAFLHRFSFGGGYITRLCVADITGKNLQVVSGWRNNDWSHFGWKGDNSFVIYSVKKNRAQASYIKQVQKQKKYSIISLINKVVHWPMFRWIKNIFKPKDKYYMLFSFDKEENLFIESGRFQEKLLDIDGHPSFTRDGKYMITDSYPDNDGMQRLIVFNTENQKSLLLGEFKAGLHGNPASCDLHPKLSQNDSYISIDTAYTGKHKMMLFKLNWDYIKEQID